MKYRILYTCVSHPGKARKVNQDNFICNGRYMALSGEAITFPLRGVCSSEDISLFGIFDGMGGEACGEIASHIAAQNASAISLQQDGAEVLSAFCQKTNQDICDFSARNGIGSAGTTAAMLLFSGKVHLCNIGDSKIFLFHRGVLHQLSADHICPAPFGVKPSLSQSLGMPPEEARIAPFFLRKGYADGDRYLICSDGLTDMVSAEEIERVLNAFAGQDAVARLLDLALENGGKDNVTILLCEIEKDPFRLFQANPLRKREE